MASQNQRRKRSLLRRDGNACVWCGLPMVAEADQIDPDGLTIEHLRPKAFGGSNELSNLALAHRRCNSERGTDQDHIVNNP